MCSRFFHVDAECIGLVFETFLQTFDCLVEFTYAALRKGQIDEFFPAVLCLLQFLDSFGVSAQNEQADAQRTRSLFRCLIYMRFNTLVEIYLVLFAGMNMSGQSF